MLRKRLALGNKVVFPWLFPGRKKDRIPTLPRWADHEGGGIVADQDNNEELQYLVGWQGPSSATDPLWGVHQDLTQPGTPHTVFV